MPDISRQQSFVTIGSELARPILSQSTNLKSIGSVACLRDASISFVVPGASSALSKSIENGCSSVGSDEADDDASSVSLFAKIVCMVSLRFVGTSPEMCNRFNSIIFCNDSSCGVNRSPDSTGLPLVGLLLFSFGKLNLGRLVVGIIFMLFDRNRFGESDANFADDRCALAKSDSFENLGCVVGSDGDEASVGGDAFFAPKMFGSLNVDLVMPLMVARFFNRSDNDSAVESYLAN